MSTRENARLYVITIYLLWVLVGGNVKDVDSFTDEMACVGARQSAQLKIEELKTQPLPKEKLAELQAVRLVGCTPVQVAQPKVS